MNRSNIYTFIKTRLYTRVPMYLLAITLSAIVTRVPCSANPFPTVMEQQDKSSVTDLLDELDDIDFVRSLTPLKLSPDQIDKLIAVITDAKTQYDKKIADLSSSTIGAMADEIHKRHKDAVAGGPVSGTFDKKVQQVMKDFYAKRDTLNADNIVTMSAACGKILTADQKMKAEQLEKDTLVKLGKKLDPSNTDSMYLNLYVVDIFIGYRRIVPLLKELKPSA